MKIVYSIMATIMLLFSACSIKGTNATKKIHDLKVLTYNIHHANPPSKADPFLKVDTIDIDAIVNVIKRENPDVVALQEIDKFVPRSGKIDEAKIIAEKAGMNYHFFKSIDYKGGEYGIVILSKYKLRNIKQIILPKIDPNAETRSMGYAEITVYGEKITFACTHLDITGEPTRFLQAKVIVKEFENLSGPIVLCGDLNSTQGSESITLLQQYFKNSCTGNCGFTVPATKPRRNIDFILTRNVNWQVSNYQVVDESYASDHRPVSATFSIK